MMFRRLVAAALLALAALTSAGLGAQSTHVMPSTGPMSLGTFVTTYLNPGLAALQSCNSGATAPAASGQPQTYQFWCDTSTTPKTLKIYDGTSWLALATIDTSGHLLALNGSSMKLFGSSSGNTVVQPSAAASGTLTLPAATDTLVGKATTDTLTNKTFDTSGTGNAFSIDGAAAQGDVVYFNGTKWTRLAAGTSGQFFKTQGAAANPIWASIAGGGDLLSTNNLSDVSSKVRSIDNLHTKGSDIVAASTTDLSSATGEYVRVTGNTTITAFGTLAAGVHRVIQFTGTPTITYNATSLILPGAANMVAAAGDMAEFISEGSGNWRLLRYTYAAPRQGGLFKITVYTSGTAATHNFDAKAKAARIRMVGGGGGSGGVDANSTTAARALAGGGGGGYVEHFIASALPASATYTVGAAGTAGTTAGTAGGNGGDTTYSDGTASLTASGGQGGAGSTSAIGNFFVGVPRAGGAATGGNVVNIPGGYSEPSFSSGTSIAAACIIVTGSGGASRLGPGGPGSGVGASVATDVASASPAGGYGGGASGTGQMLTNGTGVAGAIGAGGVLIIEEFY